MIQYRQGLRNNLRQLLRARRQLLRARTTINKKSVFQMAFQA